MVESQPVRLSDLFAGVEGWRLAGAADVDIASLSYRSDQAGPGSLFFCVPGFVRDGHDFAADAVARGAVGSLRGAPAGSARGPGRGPLGALAMGPVAAAFFGRPSSPSSDGRHHRHQRQDDVGVSGRPTCSTTPVCGPGSWARWSAASEARRCPPGGPPRRRSTSSATWPRWWRRATRRW